MIIEHVPRGCAPQMPPSNAERWAAVAELYKALRASETTYQNAGTDRQRNN